MSGCCGRRDDGVGHGQSQVRVGWPKHPTLALCDAFLSVLASVGLLLITLFHACVGSVVFCSLHSFTSAFASLSLLFITLSALAGVGLLFITLLTALASRLIVHYTLSCLHWNV